MEESKIMEESIEMKVLLNPKILELESKIKKLDNEKENFVNKVSFLESALNHNNCFRLYKLTMKKKN